jgi:hypothetical protein
MEAAIRQLGNESKAQRRLLIFAGAAAISALLFGLLFEATAHLTEWAIRGGLARFEGLGPELRLWLTIGPSIVFMLGGIVLSGRSYRRQRSRLKAHRRPRAW